MRCCNYGNERKHLSQQEQRKSGEYNRVNDSKSEWGLHSPALSQHSLDSAHKAEPMSVLLQERTYCFENTFCIQAHFAILPRPEERLRVPKHAYFNYYSLVALSL